MKKIIFIITLISFTGIVNAQMTDTTFPKQQPSNHDLGMRYLQKSKNQRTAGWIMLSTGVVITSIAFISLNNNDATLDNAITGIGFTIIGIGVACGSIPFFIVSKHSRRKANIYLQNDKMPGAMNNFHLKNIPSIGISIPLGR
jgi:hypothetical protein